MDNEQRTNDGFWEDWPVILGALMTVCILLSFLFSWWFMVGVVIGVLIFISAIEVVPPVHAGLLLRFGERVVGERTKGDDGKDVIKYVIKSEGWRLVFPIIEEIRKYSLEIHEEIIGGQKVYTQDKILIIPKVFAAWRIKDVGKVIEVNVAGRTLQEIVNDAISVAMRSAFSDCSIDDALRRKKNAISSDDQKVEILISEMLKEDIKAMTTDWGIELLELRVESVELDSNYSQDVANALEAARLEEAKKKQAEIEADKELQVRTFKAEATLVERRKEAEGIRVIADAERHKRQQEAEAEAMFLRQQIAAFSGKDPNAVTAEDSQAYAQFKTAMEMAQSLDNNSTVILPPGQLGEMVGQFLGLVKGARKPSATP